MSKHDGDLISRSALEKFIENGLNNPDKTKRFGHDAVEIVTEVHYAPAVDAVEVETLEAWLYEIAMNNTMNFLCDACEEIISRLDGLRLFARERRADHVD